MRALVFILVSFIHFASAAQEGMFMSFTDSIKRGMACTETLEQDLPGALSILIAQHFFSPDFRVGLSANGDQTITQILPDQTYTAAYERFDLPHPYTAMATLFPEQKLDMGWLRKLVAFINFENGQESFEMNLIGYHGIEGNTETVIIWKKLPAEQCMTAHIVWMPAPIIKVSEKGLRITLPEEYLVKANLSIELLDLSGVTIALKHIKDPSKGFDVPFKGLNASTYIVKFIDAGNTVFLHYHSAQTM